MWAVQSKGITGKPQPKQMKSIFRLAFAVVKKIASYELWETKENEIHRIKFRF